ncbi:MAG: YgfZ/GcvT domain-containing protein [Thiotrichales bacterium]
MKPEWKRFLSDNGAEFDANDDVVASHGNPERELRMSVNGDVFYDLSHLGLIEVYGDDARAFLQSQTTNNLNQVTPERSQLGAYCSAKGRVFALFRLLQRGETFYLSLPRDTLESTLKKLQMFVLRSKVTLADADDALVRMGLSGPRAEEELTEALGGCPQNVDDTLPLNGYTCVRVAGAMPRFEIFGELEPMQQLWHKLNVRCAPVGLEACMLLDVLAAVPMVNSASQEAFVPQMLNLHLVNGISFTKGCYPGQEIVARTQYLGQLKRRMYRVQFAASAPPVGTELFSPADSLGQAVGRIVNSARHPDGGSEALAVLQVNVVEQSAVIHLGAADGPEGSVSTPPYGFGRVENADNN